MACFAKIHIWALPTSKAFGKLACSFSYLYDPTFKINNFYVLTLLFPTISCTQSEMYPSPPGPLVSNYSIEFQGPSMGKEVFKNSFLAYNNQINTIGRTVVIYSNLLYSTGNYFKVCPHCARSVYSFGPGKGANLEVKEGGTGTRATPSDCPKSLTIPI